MPHYDYRAAAKAANGEYKVTGVFPTPGPARAAAKRFLASRGGGVWDMSYRIGREYTNRGMLSGGESGRVSPTGVVRIG